MGKENIITVGTQGVDMLSEPLTLRNEKAHFTLNLAHSEQRIETRPGINYTDTQVSGKYLGGAYHTPKYGLSSLNSSMSKTSLVVATTEGIFLIPITNDEFWDPVETSSPGYQTPVFLYTAEQYLIAVSKDGPTAWLSDGFCFHASPGSSLCSNGESYETFVNKKHEHYLPNNASAGAYIHGRNEISIDINCNNSMILSSDLIGKRKCPDNSDILLLEEEALKSTPLVASSEMGKTIVMMVMPVNDLNGEGGLFDFREGGVVEHNTLLPRESRWAKNGEGVLVKVKDGWDTKRLSRTRLSEVSAVGRYAVAKLPNDILFRSQYGLHFMKFVLGQGTLNDETVNTISQDVKPLLDADEDLEGSAVGHWMQENRFFATTGLEDRGSSHHAVGNAFVVMNQAAGYTEDRTPRSLWEGAWKTDDDIEGIHQFLKGSDRPTGVRNKRYGFTSSDSLGSIYYGAFDKDLKGYDLRDGQKIPIRQRYISGNFVLSGLSVLDIVTNGYLEFEFDDSTIEVIVSIRNETSEWCEWQRVDFENKTGDGIFTPKKLGEPPKSVRSGTYFQFKLDVVGWVKILNFEVRYKQDKVKSEETESCKPIKILDEQYLKY